MSLPDGPPAALLLDLDGTLADTHGILWDVYSAFLEGHGRTATRAEFAELDGPALPEIVRELRRRHGLEEAEHVLEREYRRALDEHYADAPPAAGAGSLLEWARASGIELALVTSAPQRLADEYLARRGWRESFAAVVSGDDADAKPSPALFTLALERLAVGPTAAVAVEDGERGVRAARAAGVAVIGVAADDARRRALTAAGADVTVGGLAEVRTLLGGSA